MDSLSASRGAFVSVRKEGEGDYKHCLARLAGFLGQSTRRVPYSDVDLSVKQRHVAKRTLTAPNVPTSWRLGAFLGGKGVCGKSRLVGVPVKYRTVPKCLKPSGEPL